jgi:hypothetical protein
VRLLPRQPDQIVLIVRDDRSSSSKGKAQVEAFVNHGDRVVYLVRQGGAAGGAAGALVSTIMFWRPSSGMRWRT